MAIKKAIYKVDTGATYDEIMFKTLAEQVYFNDSIDLQTKLNNGSLQGPQGPQGPTGPTGANGTNGAPGATGPTGPNIVSANTVTSGFTNGQYLYNNNGKVGAISIPNVSTSSAGLAPLGTNTKIKFLRDDGTWQTPLAVLDCRTNDPTNPVDGQMWFRTDL